MAASPSIPAFAPVGAVPNRLMAQVDAASSAVSAPARADVSEAALQIANQAPSQTASQCFDEVQWLALQRSTAHRVGDGAGQGAKRHENKALLYVWSPRMVFSAMHAHEVEQEARALGLRFVPVHDGRLSAEEVADALAVLPQKLQKQQHLVPGSAVPSSHPHSHSLQASVPLCAPSLVERDAYRHFPTAWVVQHGSFHPVPLVSAMPPRFWRMGLRERLQPQPVLQRPQRSQRPHPLPE